MISGFIGQLAPFQTRIKACVHKKIQNKPIFESFKEANQINIKIIDGEGFGQNL